MYNLTTLLEFYFNIILISDVINTINNIRKGKEECGL